ncbi:MAG: CHAT domain-containing protein [Steroidobacteraceae bacterium]|nr:CHAT domain-containing protein [Steroidobacteraceae bacterium]
MTSVVAPLPPPHRLHDEAIERLLASGERRRELVALLGEDAYRELSALALRAQDTRRSGPVVYVLPGLMGSRIGTRGKLLDDVIWLDPIEVAAGHLTRLALPRGARLVALGAMLLNVLKLKLSLQVAGFDARFHAYDWRHGVAGLAADLNSRIAAEGRHDVLLVGHSMGGVVARLALAAGSGRIARVVQIGAPNLGSFAPVLALRAVYPTVRKLAALDLRHDAEDLARIVFRTLPSLHELLPDSSLSGPLDLFDPAAWPDDVLRPERRQLEDAAAARERWPLADARCLHIVGVRQETVTQAQLHGREFHYTLEPAGDGTVPLRLAMLPGAKHWFVAEKHGGLPNNGKVISAVVDLLRTGSTERLPTSTRRGAARAARTVTESVMRRVAPRKVRWQDLSLDARRRLLEPVISPEFHGNVAAEALQPVAATADRPEPSAAQRVVELRLVQGSIADANAQALVLGLFRNVDPSGAATSIDERIGGAIREFVRRRMFAASLGQVIEPPQGRGALLAEHVVLAGLGDFDEFDSDAQSFIAGNVIRWLARARVEDFATVLFGTGSGIPVAAAVEQQLAGFVAGLTTADPERVIRRITICEIDARRYAALRRAAVKAARNLSDGRLRIIVDEGDASTTPRREPPARRSDTLRRDPVYLVVTLVGQGRADYECRSSLLTAGAKAAVLSGAVRVSRKALRTQLSLAESGQLGPRDMARFGTDLGRLLLPPSVYEGLATMRSRPLVVVHDGEGSRIPWEALRVGDVHPALEGGLTRRYASDTLTVARWTERPASGRKLRVLMVVDPTLDLPGAADEGAAVGRMLRAGGAEVEVLSGAAATRHALLRAFGSGSHDVLHFAGHGFFNARDPGRSGLVCAGNEVLQGADLDALGNLPALVFFNACEAARVRRRRGTGRGLFAFRRSTSVAEAFLGGGVANFVGTHWPVGDQAARSFATSFYQRLLDGAPLGDCALAARKSVLDIGSIDWADYVLYGVFDFVVVPADHGHGR